MSNLADTWPKACANATEDLVTPKAEDFRSGEIFFEETGVVTKFLIVPKSVHAPMDVLKVMLDPSCWNMPQPNITVSVLSTFGNYFGCPTGWDEWPVSWGKTPEAAAANYALRIKDLMFGIVSASAECKGWIVSEQGHRLGGNCTGALADEGVDKFKKVRPGQTHSLVNLAIHTLETWTDYKTADIWKLHMGYEETDANKEVINRMLGLKIDEDVAAPFGQNPRKRIRFSRLPCGPFKDRPELGFPLAHNHDFNALGNMPRVHCTHLVLTQTAALASALKEATEALAPHVSVVVSGKNASTLEDAVEKAMRGATVILMKESGYWVDRCVRAAEKLQGLQLTAGEEDDDAPDLPGSVNPSSFLIFDALKDTPEVVIEKLTRAMANTGGEDIMELGFAQAELERLRYAWNQVVVFRTSAAGQWVKARIYQYLVILTSLLTTVCAVVLSASSLAEEGTAEEEEKGSLANLYLSERIALPSTWKVTLELSCTILPLLLTFVISLTQRLSPAKRWMVLTAAAARVQSEIYRYRARVGDYARGSGNTKLDRLARGSDQNGQKGSGTSNSASSGSPNGASDSERVAPKTPPREVLSNALSAIQSELMGGEVKMGSLHEPSAEAMARELKCSLYPHFLGTKSFSGSSNSTSQTRSAAREEDSPLLGDQQVVNLLSTALEADEERVRDDGIGLISAEDYLRFRMLPAIKRLEARVPSLERWFNVYQFSVLLGTSSAGICGVLGLRTWIPSVVGLVAAIESLQQFHQVGAQLSGANAALTQLKNLLHWWQGLAMVGKRMNQNKSNLVEVCEDALEAELAAACQGMLRRKKMFSVAAEDEKTK